MKGPILYRSSEVCQIGSDIEDPILFLSPIKKPRSDHYRLSELLSVVPSST
jgi:hypothetical protein